MIVSEHSRRVFDDNGGQNKGSPAGARASTAVERAVANPQYMMTAKTNHLPGSTREALRALPGLEDSTANQAMLCLRLEDWMVDKQSCDPMSLPAHI